MTLSRRRDERGPPSTPASLIIKPVDGLLDRINALEPDWHGRGTVGPKVLSALARHAAACGGVAHSVETGAGRTTLLLSHMSENHLVFTIDDTGDGDSLKRVRSSPLLNQSTTHFVVGPSQRTLLAQEFTHQLDLAYIDGPHAYPFPELEYWAVYPHLRAGGLLILDDVQIPSIANMYDVLRADRMWDAVEVVDDTAFLRRTSAPPVDPFSEGWWEQGYNTRMRHSHMRLRPRTYDFARRMAPERVRALVRAVR